MKEFNQHASNDTDFDFEYRDLAIRAYPEDRDEASVPIAAADPCILPKGITCPVISGCINWPPTVHHQCVQPTCLDGSPTREVCGHNSKDTCQVRTNCNPESQVCGKCTHFFTKIHCGDGSPTGNNCGKGLSCEFPGASAYCPYDSNPCSPAKPYTGGCGCTQSVGSKVCEGHSKPCGNQPNSWNPPPPATPKESLTSLLLDALHEQLEERLKSRIAE